MEDNLIASVSKREALWNPANEHHRRGYVLTKLWQEVAVELQNDVKTIKTRWKNLRAYFWKEHKRIEMQQRTNKYRRSWHYYEQMKFLNSETSTNEVDEDYLTPFSIDETSLGERPGSVSSLDTISNHTQEPQKKKIRINHPEQYLNKKNLKKTERKSVNEKSDDLIFFEGLLPYMANLPLGYKLRLRSKIQDLISAEIEAGENNIPIESVVGQPVSAPEDKNIHIDQQQEYSSKTQDYLAITTVKVETENPNIQKSVRASKLSYYLDEKGGAS